MNVRVSTIEERESFRRVQRHPNIMTPNTLSYTTARGVLVCELTTGRGISGEPIYGVSVVDLTDLRYQPQPVSGLFYSRNEAELHIQSLGEED